MSIDRTTIKRCLLNRVLYRIDYRYLSDAEINKIVELIKTTMGNRFEGIHTESAGTYDLQLNDIQVGDNVRLRKAEDMFTYVFYSDKLEPGMMNVAPKEKDIYLLKVNKEFLILEIIPSVEKNCYKGSEYYFEFYADIIHMMYENLQLFDISRVGLRKFNSFFYRADKISEINNIFQDGFISSFNVADTKMIRKANADSYEYDNFNLNIIREFNNGFVEYKNNFDVITEIPVYLIAFDYDMYSVNRTLLNTLKDSPKDTLKHMNDNIFDIFKQSFKEDFLENIGDDKKLESDYNILLYK